MLRGNCQSGSWYTNGIRPCPMRKGRCTALILQVDDGVRIWNLCRSGQGCFWQRRYSAIACALNTSYACLSVAIVVTVQYWSTGKSSVLRAFGPSVRTLHRCGHLAWYVLLYCTITCLISCIGFYCRAVVAPYSGPGTMRTRRANYVVLAVKSVLQ